MEWIDSLHWEGILIGICTFLIIGLFHPIVVKAEYYLGTRCWWIFLLLGIAGLIGSVLVSQILLSTCWEFSHSLLSGPSRRSSNSANAY